MYININLCKNFVTAYNRMQEKYGTDIAEINGFDDPQLSYTDFINNFIDKTTVADASIDGNSNVRWIALQVKRLLIIFLTHTLIL